MKKPNNLTRILSGLVVFALLLTLCVVLGATAAAEEAADPDTCQHVYESSGVMSLSDAEKAANPNAIGKEVKTCTECGTKQTVGVYVYADFDTAESTLSGQANTGETTAIKITGGKMKPEWGFLLEDKLNLIGKSSVLQEFTLSFDVTVNATPTTMIDGSDDKAPAFFAFTSGTGGNQWNWWNNALSLNKDSINKEGAYELYFQVNSWNSTPKTLNQPTNYFIKLGTEYSVKLDVVVDTSASTRMMTVSIKEAGATSYTVLGPYATEYWFETPSYYYFKNTGDLFDNVKVTGAFTEVNVPVITTEEDFVAALGNADIDVIKLGADITLSTQTASLDISRSLTITSEVKEGTDAEYYTLTRAVGDFSMFTLSNGATVTLTNVNLDGASVEDTTSNGGAFNIPSGTALIVDAGTTIQNFKAANGGAAYSLKGTITIKGEDALINNNTAATFGGAFWMKDVAFEMSGGTVSNNTSTYAGTDGGKGGGGAFYYNTDLSPTPVISGGTIEGNSAAFGGAIYIANGYSNKYYTFTINGTAKIQNNHATEDGGAVCFHTNSPNFTLLVDGNAVIGCEGHTTGHENCKANTAKNGGAIANGNSNDVVHINGGKIIGNIATENGGAIYNRDAWGAHSVKITGGIISHNEAKNGGGIYNAKNPLTMSGGTISNNVANSGSGIYTNGQFVMTDGTITGNGKAGQTFGGGIYGSGDMWIIGGEISANTAQAKGAGIACSNSVYILGGKIIDNTIDRGGNWKPIVGTAIVAKNIYLLGGEITGNTRVGDKYGTGYGGAITAFTDGGIYIGSTMTVASAPAGVGVAGESTVTLTASEPLKIYGNDTFTANAPGQNISQTATTGLGLDAGVSTSYNITIVSDLLDGSKVVFCDNFDADANKYFAKLDAAYTTVSDTTLNAIVLFGAEQGYLAKVEGATLVWPTDAMQVEMTGGLDVAFTFNLEVFLRDASKRTGLVATFHTENKTHSPVEVVLTAADGIYTNRINPKQIMDAIVFTNGEDELGSYTFADYMDLMRTKYASDADTVALANAILNYGSAAQAYFGHNNSVLANVKYTTEAVGAVDVTPNAPNTFFAGARLYVEDEISILVKIDASKITDVENASVSATLGGSAVTGDDLVYGASGTDYYVLISRIPAAQLLDECVITVDGNVLTYGVADYAYRMQDNAEGGELAKALYAYAVAVEGYTPVV